MDNKRSFSRVNFNVQANILYKDGKFPGNLVDISLKGALIDMLGENFPLGMTCQIEIVLNTNLKIIINKAELKHFSNEGFGFGFLLVDLDGLTHLRKLLEVNLGDPKLIERELTHLGKH